MGGNQHLQARVFTGVGKSALIDAFFSELKVKKVCFYCFLEKKIRYQFEPFTVFLNCLFVVSF